MLKTISSMLANAVIITLATVGMLIGVLISMSEPQPRPTVHITVPENCTFLGLMNPMLQPIDTGCTPQYGNEVVCMLPSDAVTGWIPRLTCHLH